MQKNLQFCRLPKWHFLEALSFFCHFGAICSNICKTSEIIRKIAEKWQKWQCLEKNHFFATCKIVIFLSFFWGSCGGFFVIFLSFWRGFSKILKSIKFFEKWHKNDKKYGSASGKMQFLQPAKLSFFLVIFWCNFCQKNWKRTTFREKCNFCNLQKLQKIQIKRQTKTQIQMTKMTIKMTDKLEMTKMTNKWKTKLKLLKNDNKNDKWQIKYFDFFDLCLPKFLLTLIASLSGE